jgi:hypothetical protein
MKAPYQAPALQAAGSFAKVTDGQCYGYHRDYWCRRRNHGGGHGR